MSIFWLKAYLTCRGENIPYSSSLIPWVRSDLPSLDVHIMANPSCYIEITHLIVSLLYCQLLEGRDHIWIVQCFKQSRCPK